MKTFPTLAIAKAQGHSVVQAEGGWVAHRPPAIIPVPRLSKVARSASAGLVDRYDWRRGDHRTGVGSSCSLSKIRIGAPTARHVIVSLLKPIRPSIRLLLRCGPSFDRRDGADGHQAIRLAPQSRSRPATL